MKFTLSLVLVLSFPVVAQKPAAEGSARKARLTFADLGKRIRWGQPAPRVSWARDGKHVQMRTRGGMRWLDPKTLEEKAAERRPRQARKLPLRARTWKGDIYVEEAQPRRRGRRWRPQPPSKDAVRVTKDGGNKRIATLSPDQKRASYTQGGNLFVAEVGGGPSWQVTKKGSRKLLHGVLDWVYQEEIYGRGNFRGHWWSPDSRYVAFLQLDESKVKDFTVINHVPAGFLDRERAVVPEITSYPKSGDPNPTVRLAIADVVDQKVTWLDLGDYDKDILVVRVGFTPDSKKLLFAVQDRIQTWADINAADPATGTFKTWIRENSKTWTPRPPAPRWLQNGGFLWTSHRTGYQHVYHYDRAGKLVGALTNGDWQVSGIRAVDEKRGLLWFSATKDGALDNNEYRVGLDGKGLHRLTSGNGSHRVSWNGDRSYFLDTHSAMAEPQSVRLCDADGKVVKVLGRGADASRGRYAYCPTKRLTIKARDGYALDASVILPLDFDANGKHPIYLPTYSGPGAPTVREGYGASTLHQVLAHQGCIVLRVNVRSAAGRGMKDRGTCYKQLGVQELRDLEDAVRHVIEHHAGDPKRVAIQGWSYGGFMAAYALTHSKVFSLGIAGAGVYDWRLYDTVYTERYMSTPQKNPDGYDRSSVIKAAGKLHGHLVIVHGTMDDNVHLQNAMQLAFALQMAGKQNFEMMLYPRSRHDVGGRLSRHWMGLQSRVLRHHLRLDG